MSNSPVKLVNGAVFTLNNHTFLFENNLLHEVELVNNDYKKTGKTYTIKEANRLLYA